MEFLKQEQRTFLEDGNYLRGQTPEERYQQIVDRVDYYNNKLGYSEGLEDRIKELLWKNILQPSTPVLANFGRTRGEGKNTLPLPVSCNVVSVPDSIDGIYSANHEVAMLSKLGAGVGVDFTQIRDAGSYIDDDFYSNSKLDWIEAIVDTSQKVAQNSTRRGYSTPFISIEDKEYDILMDRVDKSNPNEKDPLLDNTIGVKIGEGFMQKVFDGDKHSQTRFARLLKIRKNTGKAYVVFEENMCKNMSDIYTQQGEKPINSNICTEVCCPSYEDKTFACVLSALNLVYWDDITDQDIKDIFMFLDIINEDYIQNTKNVPGLEKARRSAMEKRDVGFSVLGFHDLLQKKGFALGDMHSRALNKDIFSRISKVGYAISGYMGYKLGSPDMIRGKFECKRNVSLMMIAPHKSTSAIAGMTSGGIEPFKSNYYVRKLAKIEHEFKNPHLEKLLQEKDKNTFEIWQSIMENQGSVQHLDFLSDKEKDVFKTFSEISPKDIIDLASDRQKYIDMGQSLNLVFRQNYTMKDIYEIHKYAFEKEIKTLYYAYPDSHAAIGKDGDAWDSCTMCAD